MDVEMVVYYDPNFPSSWIKHNQKYPKKIADYFFKKGIRLLDANQLKEFMLDSIREEQASKRLIVFSQDVAPKTVIENYYSTTTFREYLDAGGSILWIGDIPLYYIGDEGEEKPTLVDIQGTPTNMLGIVPVYAFHPKTTVTISAFGRKIGLRSKWSGTRPILRDTGIKTIAKSESVACRYYMDIEQRKNLLSRFWDWVRTIKTFKAASFEIGREITNETKDLQKGLMPKIRVHEAHLNAWLKCFNSYHPSCGFYRIWDYEPRNLTDNRIEELFDIADSICRRIKRSSGTFWLS